MTLKPAHRLFALLLPACLALVACGGGGGGGGGGAGYEESTSASFSPSKAKASSGKDVPLHWVYAVNGGRPVTTTLLDVSVGITVEALEVTLDPANLVRKARYQGPVTASADGVAYSGDYSASVDEHLRVAGSTTDVRSITLGAEVALSGGGDSGSAQLTATIDNFRPAYDWFPDRETLDALAVGHVETVSTNASLDLRITATGETPIVQTNLPTSASDRWTVLAKLPTMVVRGKSYSNVVQLSRLTQLPSFSTGQLTPVTMNYWVAKGIGLIKGQGQYRVLNMDNVEIELTETNLVQK